MLVVETLVIEGCNSIQYFYLIYIMYLGAVDVEATENKHKVWLL